MKKILLGLAVILVGVLPSAALVTQHSNSVNLVLADVCDGTFKDFKFSMAGYDDQYFSFNYDKVLTGIACTFRITKPIEGTIYLDVPSSDITVSGTSVTFTIAHSNIPPPASYYGELLSYEATTTNFYRSIAQGMLPVTWSLYLNESNYFARSTTNASVGQVYVHPNWVDPPWLGTNEGLGSTYATLTKHNALSGWTDIIYGHVTNLQEQTNGFIQATADASDWTNNKLSWGDAGDVTNVPEILWSASSNDVITKAAQGADAYAWGRHAGAGYLSSQTNIFSTLYVGNRGKLGTNLSGLTAGAYTGTVGATVAYTGVTVMAIGRMYSFGFDKVGSQGTATLAIASQSISKTAAGLVSNYFVMAGSDTNLILTLDGTATSLCKATNVYVKEITNGTASIAEYLNVGRAIYIGRTNGLYFSDTQEVNSAAISDWNAAYGCTVLQAGSNTYFEAGLTNLMYLRGMDWTNQANTNTYFEASITNLQTDFTTHSNNGVANIKHLTDLQTNLLITLLPAATNDLSIRVGAVETGKVDRVGDTNAIDLSAADCITIPPSCFSNSPVIRQELDDAIDSVMELVIYAATNAHDIIASARGLWDTPPGTTWTNETTWASDSNQLVEVYFYTNSTTRIRGGQYKWRVVCFKESSTKDIHERIQMVYSDDNGATTNIISTMSAAKPIGTAVASYPLTVNVPADITNSTLWLGVRRYLEQSGTGVSPTVYTLGGLPYNTHLATPGVGDVAGYVTDEVDPAWGANSGAVLTAIGTIITNAAGWPLFPTTQDVTWLEVVMTVETNPPTWTEVSGLPTARSYLAAFSLNGKGYAVGGHGEAALTNVYEFNGTDWTEVAGLPEARYFLAAFSLNGKGYAVGGFGEAAVTNVYEFSPLSTITNVITNTWTLGPSGGVYYIRENGTNRFSTTDWATASNQAAQAFGWGHHAAAGYLTNEPLWIADRPAITGDIAGLKSSYQAFTATITPDAGGTCTISYASGSLVKIDAVTGGTFTVTFDNTDYPTNGVNRVGLEIWAPTNPVAFDNATITNVTAPTITNTWASLFFRKVTTNLWYGRQ